MTARTLLPLTSLLTAAAMGILPPLANAQWARNGVSVYSWAVDQNNGRVSADGQGGAFVAWKEQRTAETDQDLYALHILASGLLDPAWPAGGLLVAGAQGSDQTPEKIILDRSGGFYVSWQDGRNATQDVYVQRLMPNGHLSPGWPSGGIPIAIGNSQRKESGLCLDAGNGLFVSWSDASAAGARAYWTHFLGDGSLAPGWPARGRAFVPDSSAQGAPRLIGQVDGGVIGVWADSRQKSSRGVNTFALRMTADGTPTAGWPAGGVPVQSQGSRKDDSDAASDGAGGLFVTWDDTRAAAFTFDYDIYAQHILASGIVDPRWPTNGLPVCTAIDEQLGLEMVSDGFGGALFAWQDNRDSNWQLYGQHLLADGSIVPGWMTNGIPLLASPWGKYFIGMVPDEMGGFYAVWEQIPFSNQVYAQHMAGNGQMAPGWPGDGLPIGAEDGEDFSPTDFAPDGFGGALVIMERSFIAPWAPLGGATQDNVQRIMNDGPVPTRLAFADAEVAGDRVTVRWQSQDAATVDGTVERSNNATDWIALGAPRLVSADLLEFEDVAVPEGRHAYRLTYGDASSRSSTEPAWVTVASTAGLALSGFQPNPAIQGANVAFTLPDELPATLRVHDVRGGLVYSKDVGAMGRGAHTLRLGEERNLVAGVYWIQLVRADKTLSTKGLVIR